MVSESSLLRTLAQRIKYYRSEREWSQEELARKATLNRTYLAAIERGSRNPSLRSLLKLANAFGVSVGSLFEPITVRSESIKRTYKRKS